MLYAAAPSSPALSVLLHSVLKSPESVPPGPTALPLHVSSTKLVGFVSFNFEVMVESVFIHVVLKVCDRKLHCSTSRCKVFNKVSQIQFIKSEKVDNHYTR